MAIFGVSSNVVLPDEILLHIFKYHVHGNADTPNRLLRVSRRWRDITVNSPCLWCDILYTNEFSLEALRREGGLEEKVLQRKIICRTIDALANAIQRTRNYPFELTIILYGLDSANDEEDVVPLETIWFSEKCRTLRIRSDFIRPMVLDAVIDMPLLEELEIEVGSDLHEPMATLLDVVERTSINLRHFKIRSQAYQTRLHQYPNLMSRLKSLDVNPYDIFDLKTAINGAVSLHSLALKDAANYQEPFLAAPSLPLVDELCMHGVIPSIAAHLYPNLTSLRLHYIHYSHSYTFQLPCLLHLTLSGSWHPIMHMNAPLLQKVTLRDGFQLQTEKLRLIRSSTIRPTWLEIDMTNDNDDFRFLFSDTWGDLEKLQITYVSDGEEFHDLFGNAPLGNKNRRPVCPNLNHLTIIAPFPTSERNKVEAQTRLRKLVEERRKSNKVLKSVRLGWYPVHKLHADVSRSSEDLIDDWEIQWSDIK